MASCPRECDADPGGGDGAYEGGKGPCLKHVNECRLLRIGRAPGDDSGFHARFAGRGVHGFDDVDMVSPEDDRFPRVAVEVLPQHLHGRRHFRDARRAPQAGDEPEVVLRVLLLLLIVRESVSRLRETLDPLADVIFDVPVRSGVLGERHVQSDLDDVAGGQLRENLLLRASHPDVLGEQPVQVIEGTLSGCEPAVARGSAVGAQERAGAAEHGRQMAGELEDGDELVRAREDGRPGQRVASRFRRRGFQVQDGVAALRAHRLHPVRFVDNERAASASRGEPGGDAVAGFRSGSEH
jgi:hypothetical protein